MQLHKITRHVMLVQKYTAVASRWYRCNRRNCVICNVSLVHFSDANVRSRS